MRRSSEDRLQLGQTPEEASHLATSFQESPCALALLEPLQPRPLPPTGSRQAVLMDLEAAEQYLTEKIHEAPLGSPQQRDYIARRRHIRRMIKQQRDNPPAA